jgi:hypothetical protein
VLPWCYSRFGKLPRASSKLNEGVAFRHCKPFVSEQLRDVSEWHFRLAQRRSECMTAIMPAKRFDARHSHSWDKTISVVAEGKPTTLRTIRPGIA